MSEFANYTSPIYRIHALRDRYDLPVYGLGSERFYALHIPALTCIFLSLISAITSVILSFGKSPRRKFFSWTKSERFVVYMAICDGSFNVAHSIQVAINSYVGRNSLWTGPGIDHLHIVITKYHVYPPTLCQFYSFTLLEFVTAQILMVNIVAVNAFMLINLNKQLKFGKRDWRLLLWIFGFPFLLSSIALAAKQFGPSGAFCFFDGVNGQLAQFLLASLPLAIILLVNATLYVLTWIKLRSVEHSLKESLGKQASATRMKHSAVRAMSLFVLAFIIQWWSLALFGIWVFINPVSVPPVLFHTVTIFSNTGGILNLGVYILIRRGIKLHKQTEESSSRTGTKETSHTEL